MTVTINGATGIAGVNGTAVIPAMQGSDTNTGVFYGTDIVAVSTGGTERMRINALGQAEFTAGTAALPAITATGDTNTGVFYPAADAVGISTGGTERMRVNASGQAEFTAGTAALPAITATGDTNTGVFYPAADTVAISTGGTERMRINTASVGIGSTLTTSGLTVGYVGSNGWNINTISTTTASVGAIVFTNPNGVVGSINTSGSATAYSTSSDYRLKENIAPMTGALATVQALKPVTYKWKIDGSAGQGFIAHELAEVAPDCVSGEKDAVHEDGSIKAQGVDYSKIVVHLVAAIQEQQAIITALTARITALEVTP